MLRRLQYNNLAAFQGNIANIAREFFSVLATPYSKEPLLLVSGRVIQQIIAITRFVGQEVDLAPSTTSDLVFADNIVASALDLRTDGLDLIKKLPTEDEEVNLASIY